MPLLTCIMAFHAYFRWMQGKLVEESNKKGGERKKERGGLSYPAPKKAG